MVFVLLVPVLFLGLLPFIIWVGGIGGRGGIKLVSANTPSANEPAKDFILVHTEVRLVETLSGRLYWGVELCVPSLHI